MRNRIPQDQEDDLKSRQSVLNRLPRPQPKKKSNKGILIISGALICLYFITIYYYNGQLDKALNKKGSDGQLSLTSLNQKIKRLEQSEQQAKSKFASLENQYKTHLVKEKNGENTKSQVVPIPVSSNGNPNKVKVVPAPYKHPTRPESVTKPSYLTPQLDAISEFRTQKGGMIPVTGGDKREIKFFKTNKDGKKAEQVLYKDEETRKKRGEFVAQRTQFLTGKTQFQSLHLSNYNLIVDPTKEQEQMKIEADQYARIDKIYNFQAIKNQLPMCLVVPGYNNNAKFRIEYNLNSIFTQNYTNYFVVIINDASTDGSDELYRKYFDFYGINKDRYVYIQNYDRKTALQNIYMATNYYCSQDSIVLNIDGDDEFIGRNVLKAFNAGYQTQKAGVVYSNFFWYEQGANIMLGFTSSYTDAEKKSNSYRQAPQRFSHLRSYRTQLFRQIEAKDFQDAKGQFFKSAYDMAMYFPLMELSCGRISKISGYHYLYNINTGLNDYAVDRNKQATVDQTVRNAKKYTCDNDFDKRMNLK